ncbi:MAG: HAMP domain-containing histidine kinase [Treponema sp.]|nr:HAMP domain-containing histidine kinase [Treponema sp.]
MSKEVEKDSKKRPKEKKQFTFSVFSFRNYAFVFLGVSIVTTVSIIVFFWDADLPFSKKVLSVRAIAGFINVFIMSFIFTLLIRLHRKIEIERPIKQLLNATESIRQGDFSVQIPRRKHFRNEIDVVIDNINLMARELSGVETLRLDFISNVSHELKTPLSVIQNYATMLQEPNLQEETRLEYAKSITAASRNLTTLITNILRLNKLENQQIFPERKEFNLSEQITECLLDFEQIWEDKKISLETDIDDSILAKGDSELLSLVWHNLFSNAFKFTPDGGKVSVSLKKSGGLCQIKVSDTGCGMSEETQKHIFEKFYQGDRSHAQKGNGLGLALVKRILDITGGEIEVRSKEGEGSSFTATI